MGTVLAPAFFQFFLINAGERTVPIPAGERTVPIPAKRTDTPVCP